MDITKEIQLMMDKHVKKTGDLQNLVNELLYHSTMMTKGYYDADFTTLAKVMSDGDWANWLRNQLEGNIFLTTEN